MASADAAAPAAPIPEHAELHTQFSDNGPFHKAASSPLEMPPQPPPSKPRGWCACCAVKGEDDELSSGAAASGTAGSVSDAARSSGPDAGGIQPGSSLVKRLSQRGSSFKPRRSFKKVGSHAYSDAEWFDAASKFEPGGSGDHAAMMADVDQLVKELSVKGPWVPDPPLAFGVPNMYFIPISSGSVAPFMAFWLRDDERTTPPPQPIDVMLKASYVVQKTHNSIPGVWLYENEAQQVTMVVKPTFVPPGLPRYVETYDKSQQQETEWMLRRDLKPGRSFGRIFLTSDGTLVLRVQTRGLFSNTRDITTEEYLRLEDGGNVVVARQCCLHHATGKRAVQYLVGRRQDGAPKGW